MYSGAAESVNLSFPHFQNLVSYSFTNLEILEILEILELSYQFIMFFAEMFRKMPETVLYALMPNVTRFFFINNIINQKY